MYTKKVNLGFSLVIGLVFSCSNFTSSHASTKELAKSPQTQAADSLLIANNSSQISCDTELEVGEEYVCILSPLKAETTFSLNNAPTGMVIQPNSGYLHWTPAANQSGTHEVEIISETNEQSQTTIVTFDVVTSTVTAPTGIYLAPNGNDRAEGTIDDPLLSLHKAAQIAEPGDTIFLRGGTYFNDGYGNPSFEGRRNNLARITTSGTAENWITIRPHGNEYVKLKSDVNGIVFKNASYWRVEGIELEGTTQELDENIALSLWWDESAASNKIKGRGIAMNSSFHIEIADSIVRDFPGAGVSNNGGANITLRDSIVYNNAWWSTAGTHGFANSKPRTNDNNDLTSFKMTMSGNLVFGNQSSVISHVFSKGFVKLEIDEGNGLHMQNTEGLFFGRFLAENNLLIYNGKAGLGLNTIANSDILNNSFYHNAQAVLGSGEISLQPPTEENPQPNVIEKNLFHPLPDRVTFKVFKQTNPYEGVRDNYTVPAQDSDIVEGVKFVNNVFSDPENNDFSPSSSIASDYGVSPDTLAVFAAKIEEYGITIAPAPTAITDSYLKKMKLRILRNWPAPDPNDPIPDDLYLEDGKTKFCYTYEDRNRYPAPPRTIVPSCNNLFAD